MSEKVFENAWKEFCEKDLEVSSVDNLKLVFREGWEFSQKSLYERIRKEIDRWCADKKRTLELYGGDLDEKKRYVAQIGVLEGLKDTLERMEKNDWVL